MELEVPLHYPVSAVVYFTSKMNHDIKDFVHSHTVFTNSTVMVFQLESHDIPEIFHKDEFLVQISLRVSNTESAIVPANLEKAPSASKTYIIYALVFDK